MAGEAIFIGYRRDDTADVSGRIYDALTLRFGQQRVFKDVDNIGPGVDFGDYIKSVLPRCRVALILIGPNWLDSRDASGRRRIDDQHDWVRIEVETALRARDLLVVPVLVNGASMPRSETVPESVRPLLRRNAAIIRRDPDFHDDVERLATALRASVKTGILDMSNLNGAVSGAHSGSRKSGGGGSPWPFGLIAMAVALATIGYASGWLPAQLARMAGSQVGAQAEPGPAQEDASQTPQTQAPVQRELGALPRSPPETLPEGPDAPSMAPPEPQLARVFRDCAECPEMVRMLGQSFAVGRYEVTFAQWDACVGAGGCNGYRPSDQGWGRGNRPVIYVSWNDANAYVDWLSQRTGQRYRLLTSAEWEFAARAGALTPFSWGNEDPVCDEGAPNGANFIACPDDRTRPVGSFQPNAFGLFDVHGNVWEWVEDCFDASCSNRMLRGGSSDNYANLLRVRERLSFQQNGRTYASGMRVARAI